MSAGLHTGFVTGGWGQIELPKNLGEGGGALQYGSVSVQRWGDVCGIMEVCIIVRGLVPQKKKCFYCLIRRYLRPF